MPSARVTTRQRSIGAVASAAFHIAILIGLAFELDKPIADVESPAIQVSLAPPLTEPPPIPIPIIPPTPKPTPVEKVTPTTPAPAAPAKPQPAPVQPAAAAAPTPVTTPAPKAAPTVRVKAATPVAHAAPTPAPTPIAHTSPSLIQAPLAPVLLPPAPQAAAASASPAAQAAASAPPGAAVGPNGLRDALRLGFGCAHPDAVNLTAAEREACKHNAVGRGGPAFAIQPPSYIQHEGEVNEAWRRYQTSNSSHDYPGLRCAAGRDCEPDRPTPPPDPINDTCPYLRCNMGNVR
ncbi:MAG TPA: hypothetical protein VGL73_01785 [Caulobacteraceae bacterium]